jgi:hypothetical protein
MMRAQEARRPGLSEIRAALLIVAVLAGLILPFTPIGELWILPLFVSSRQPHERSSSASLKTLTVAQVDFRANDRDGNGVQDFWKGDVAGLYGICPPNTTEMIKLLEISVAGADCAPLNPSASPPTPGLMTGQAYYSTRSPKGGYWYRALLHADEPKPDPNRFAFCSFPAQYGAASRWTFIVDEKNTIYRKDLGPRGALATYPLDPLGEGWIKID